MCWIIHIFFLYYKYKYCLFNKNAEDSWEHSCLAELEHPILILQNVEGQNIKPNKGKSDVNTNMASTILPEN